MKFDVTKAEHDYVTDTTMSYRKLAEKYEVDQATVSKYGKLNKWVDKRKEFQAKVKQKSLDKASEKKSDGLAKLSAATVTAINIVVGRLNGVTEETESKELKEYVNMLKELTGIHRNLTGSLTQQELNQYELAKEKLIIERERAGINEDDDDESGIVFIPDIKENVDDNVIIEGGDNA